MWPLRAPFLVIFLHLRSEATKNIYRTLEKIWGPPLSRPWISWVLLSGNNKRSRRSRAFAEFFKWIIKKRRFSRDKSSVSQDFFFEGFFAKNDSHHFPELRKFFLDIFLRLRSGNHPFFVLLQVRRDVKFLPSPIKTVFLTTISFAGCGVHFKKKRYSFYAHIIWPYLPKDVEKCTEGGDFSRVAKFILCFFCDSFPFLPFWAGELCQPWRKEREPVA